MVLKISQGPYFEIPEKLPYESRVSDSSIQMTDGKAQSKGVACKPEMATSLQSKETPGGFLMAACLVTRLVPPHPSAVLVVFC